jgi:uncharacterized protein YlxW (UPF0749 family)|tara:strand:- start:1477 stop:1791 length:315 start_codon:yes stop_codon:yes gene_type:complete
MSNLESILIALVCGLTSANAWQYYQKRIQALLELEREEKKEKNQYQDKLAKEVDELKEKLSKIYKQREEELNSMNERILELSNELARMKVKIQYLEKENQELRG